MMGHRQVDQAALFYEFSLEAHVLSDHLLRSIDRFVELGELRRELHAFYSTTGRPSVDPELMLRMLIVGYCFGIRSERRLGRAREQLIAVDQIVERHRLLAQHVDHVPIIVEVVNELIPVIVSAHVGKARNMKAKWPAPGS